MLRLRLRPPRDIDRARFGERIVERSVAAQGCDRRDGRLLCLSSRWHGARLPLPPARVNVVQLRRRRICAGLALKELVGGRPFHSSARVALMSGTDARSATFEHRDRF